VKLRNEPVAILAVIEAAIALGVGFGLELSTEQVGLIMAVASGVIGLIARSQVTPVAKLAPVDDAVDP
jgi:hypothetical protein